MPFPSIFFSRLLPLGGAFAVLLVQPGPARSAPAQQQVEARYSISLMGLPLGHADVTGQLDPSSYRVAINTRLTGFAAMVNSTRAAATASGAYLRGLVIPSAYANTSANSRGTRTVRMAMQSGSVRGVDVSPPLDPSPDRVPVTEAHKRNIVDPVSALIMPVPGSEPLIGPAACNRTIPMYDGFARFDVALTYVGTRQVQAKGYSGPVAVCAVRYKPLAGHRDRRPVQMMAENRDINVWLAPIGSSRLVMPYRISVATSFGTAVIEATDFVAAARRAPAAL